jgi:hypothetical protein
MMAERFSTGYANSYSSDSVRGRDRAVRRKKLTLARSMENNVKNNTRFLMAILLLLPMIGSNEVIVRANLRTSLAQPTETANYSYQHDGQSLTVNPVQCDESPEEARERGCQCDVLSFAWHYLEPCPLERKRHKCWVKCDWEKQMTGCQEGEGNDGSEILDLPIPRHE